MGPKREPPAAKKIRILCFGDSLTAGYCGWGTVYHPYRDKLVQMVEMAFPEYEVETAVDGISGDMVGPGGGFKGRMEKRCKYTFTLRATYETKEDVY
jgi:lysophospholipase L1-like esterase